MSACWESLCTVAREVSARWPSPACKKIYKNDADMHIRKLNESSGKISVPLATIFPTSNLSVHRYFWGKQRNIRWRSNIFVHGESQRTENPNACVHGESQRAENPNACVRGDYQRADTTEISAFWYISSKICIKIRCKLWKHRIYEDFDIEFVLTFLIRP